MLYPGLKSHPQHEIAKSQQHGFGGMITFFLDSDLAGAERFLKQCKYFTLAESLGGVESLIEHPVSESKPCRIIFGFFTFSFLGTHDACLRSTTSPSAVGNR